MASHQGIVLRRDAGSLAGCRPTPSIPAVLGACNMGGCTEWDYIPKAESDCYVGGLTADEKKHCLYLWNNKPTGPAWGNPPDGTNYWDIFCASKDGCTATNKCPPKRSDYKVQTISNVAYGWCGEAGKREACKKTDNPYAAMGGNVCPPWGPIVQPAQSGALVAQSTAVQPTPLLAALKPAAVVPPTATGKQVITPAGKVPGKQVVNPPKVPAGKVVAPPKVPGKQVVNPPKLPAGGKKVNPAGKVTTGKVVKPGGKVNPAGKVPSGKVVKLGAKAAVKPKP